MITLFKKKKQHSTNSSGSDTEVVVEWRGEMDSKSDSVILRGLTREDYVKSKLMEDFKEKLVDLLPLDQVLHLKYDIDAIDSSNIKRLDLLLKILGMRPEVLGFSNEGPLQCRIYPSADREIAVQFLWSMNPTKLHTRFRAFQEIKGLQSSFGHRRLEIEVQYNKQKFESSDLIGIIFIFKDDNALKKDNKAQVGERK